jgi:hypothetical protein
MLPLVSEVLVLTPRGGVDNHRFITWSGSGLDSTSSGRIYREVKSILGERGRGIGSLSDGAYFAAASHIVAQEEVAGRRGSEWLIFTDPRIGRLGEGEQDRLLNDVERHLAQIGDEVLGNIAWENYSGSDTIRVHDLDSWARHFAQHLDSVRSSNPVGGLRGIAERRVPGNRPSPIVWGLVMIGGIAAILLAMQGVELPFLQKLRPSQDATERTQRDVLVKASTALGLGGQAADGSVREKLALFFVTPGKIEDQNVEETLEELRSVAMGRDRGAIPLLEDEAFWNGLEDALRRRDAFLSASDRDVVKGLNDPRGVRTLADIARRFREMDKDAARPDDQLLRPLFNGLCRCSDEVARIGEAPTVVVFTATDARLARALLAAFQESGAEIERNTKAVPNKEQLAAWVDALGSAQGQDVFASEYFRGELMRAAKNASQPKQECLQLLKEFCEACQGISKSASIR